MRKADLRHAVTTAKTDTKTALQTMYDALNQGQQKKLVKNEAVRVLLVKYGVIVNEDPNEEEV